MEVSLHTLSLWNILSNLGFLLAAIFIDILHIRICIFASYIFLTIHVFAGSPTPPTNFIYDPDFKVFALDKLIWYILSIPIHLMYIFSFLSDDKPVPFHSPGEEKIFALLYRRAGAFPRECRILLDVSQIKKYSRGEMIAPCISPARLQNPLGIIIKGRVRYEHPGKERENSWRYSGDAYGLDYFMDLVYHRRTENRGIEGEFDVVADSEEVEVLEIDYEGLKGVVGGVGDALKRMVWRYVFYNFSVREFRDSSDFMEKKICFATMNVREREGWFEGEETVDMRPLEKMKWRSKGFLDPEGFSFWNWIMEMPRKWMKKIRFQPARGFRHSMHENRMYEDTFEF